MYHTGTDSIQVNYVTVDVQEGHRFECRMPLTQMDDKAFVQSADCYVVSYNGEMPEE